MIVIGGGDTGTDCVATALRHGCRSLVQFEIVPQPPGERCDDNPWPEWPKVFKVDYGQEEAMAVYGKEPRFFCINTVKFAGDANGNVQEVHTVEVKWERDTSGCLVPKGIPGTEKVWPTQLALLALGFLGPEEALLDKMGVEKVNNYLYIEKFY